MPTTPRVCVHTCTMRYYNCDILRSIVVYYLVCMCCLPRITKPAAAHNNQCFIVLLLFFALRLLRNDITPWVVQTVNGSNPRVHRLWILNKGSVRNNFWMRSTCHVPSFCRLLDVTYTVYHGKGFLRIFMFGFRTEHHGPLLRKLQVLWYDDMMIIS